MAAATSSCGRLNVTLTAAPPTVRFKSGASSSGSTGRGGAGFAELATTLGGSLAAPLGRRRTRPGGSLPPLVGARATTCRAL